MHACHHARIQLLRSISSRDHISFLPECISIHSQYGEYQEAVSLMKKHNLMDTKPVLKGIANSTSIDWKSTRVVEQLELDQSDQEVVDLVARIFARNGIHPRDEQRLMKIIDMVKLRSRDPTNIIGCLRKLKSSSSKKFAWEMYLREEEEKSLEEKIHEYIACLCAVNGWGDRVKTVLDRHGRTKTRLSYITAKMLIKALCHYPHGSAMSGIVEEIISRCCDQNIDNEIIEFYSINKQYKLINKFFSSNSSTTPTHQVSLETFRPIFKNSHGKIFFHYFDMCRNTYSLFPNELVFNKAIQESIKLKSGRRLIEILEQMYLQQLAVGQIEICKIKQLAEDIENVPKRVRQKLKSTISLHSHLRYFRLFIL